MAGRHGSLPLRVAVVVSGWGSGLVLWVGALALAKRVFSHHRTPVPRTPEFRTTDSRLQSYDAMTTIPNFRPILLCVKFI